MRKTTEDRYSKDWSVLGNLNHERITDLMRSDYGKGMMRMLIQYAPWDTFGTMTVRPDYGNRIEERQCGMSPEAMKKLVQKFFSRRPFRHIKYLWVIEKNMPANIGGKGGTHAHFLTSNDRDVRWTKAWTWWHETKGYGRFQTKAVDYDKMTRLAAYLSKYCVKDCASADWGLERFSKAPALVLEQQIATPEGPFVEDDSVEFKVLERETFDWSKKVRRMTPTLRI